jgi:hypothetical protein
MFVRALGIMSFGAALLAGANALQAQTATTPSVAQTPSLESCRAEAIRRGISGDGLTQFLNNCMSQPAGGTSGQRAGYDRCRSDAVSRNLVGDARYTYIDDCMQRAGAMDSATGEGTYPYCRAQARAQLLSGTQLEEFLNGCVSR